MPWTSASWWYEELKFGRLCWAGGEGESRKKREEGLPTHTEGSEGPQAPAWVSVGLAHAATCWTQSVFFLSGGGIHLSKKNEDQEKETTLGTRLTESNFQLLPAGFHLLEALWSRKVAPLGGTNL